MSARRVTVVDFGAGNLLSVLRALRHCGADADLAETPEQILAAERLILPGVGAFADAMSGIQARDLTGPLRLYAGTGRPFLGICVGMQVLFEASEEFGEHAGLGLIPGRVKRIPATDGSGSPLKVPHIGWNALVEPRPGAWAKGMLAGTAPGAYAYFVHSFAGSPVEPAHRYADCLYGGHTLTAAVQRDNLFGCQFHPEKSGPLGLRLIESFLTL